jgi:hypothetical protein
VKNNEELQIRSHVARDFIQNAQLFKTDKLVVWEYVSNSLQYVEPGVNPVVRVTLESKRKRITIEDNGRGMSFAGLNNFFLMHGENIDRKVGRPGRGRFGTGKSAAFGIADILRVTTVCNNKRSKVELKRSDIEAMSSGAPIPVRVLEKETQFEHRNGTVVEIEGIHLRSLDQSGIIHYIERHLTKWPRNCTVLVNHHECELAEPQIAREVRFKPDGETAESLGEVELVIKVSSVPLDEDVRGISVFTKGIWCETTLAGSEGRDMSQYIFGEIDVPRLDDDKSPIPPFDLSRSMRLNPSNTLVQTLYGFIGKRIEDVRREIVRNEKERKSEEAEKRLAEQGAEIATIINEDFIAFKRRIVKALAKTKGGFDLYPGSSKEDLSDDFLLGGDDPAEIIALDGDPGHGDGIGGNGTQIPDRAPQVVAGSNDSRERGHRAGKKKRESKSPRGGFQVLFKNMGADSHRAVYVSDERTIYINLDHPQVEAAIKLSSVEDPIFQRLSYEIAFSEYAIALASELASRDEYIDPSDPIVEIRDTINRIARRASTLYSE